MKTYANAVSPSLPVVLYSPLSPISHFPSVPSFLRVDRFSSIAIHLIVSVLVSSASAMRIAKRRNHACSRFVLLTYAPSVPQNSENDATS